MTRISKNVFLSYRRDDSSGHTGRLHDQLVPRLGRDRLFLDIDNQDFGVDYVDVIDGRLNDCGVLVLVIGPNWLAGLDEDGMRRIDDESDFHRLEIERALERKIRIIPALVGGAKPPKQRDLPDSLKSLARRQAFEISDTRFAYDSGKLAEAIDASLQATQTPEAQVLPAAAVPGATTAAAQEQEPPPDAWLLTRTICFGLCFFILGTIGGLFFFVIVGAKDPPGLGITFFGAVAAFFGGRWSWRQAKQRSNPASQ